MTVIQLIEELKKYPDNYSIEIDGHWEVDNVRNTGKCSLSLESTSLRELIANYEYRITPEYMKEYLNETYWHDRKPSEEGWYLCIEKIQSAPYMLRYIDMPFDNRDEEFQNIILWHKIPDEDE